jgi:hypothetical protein
MREIFYFTEMEFVPIFSYDNYVPAHIAMGTLKEENIECWLKDENTITLDPLLNNALGGIKLMVEKQHAQRAYDLLIELERNYKANWKCPNCSSANIEVVTSPKQKETWFSLITAFFTSTLPLTAATVHHCFDCGHEFKQEEADINS